MFSIGALATQTGVKVPTIRYYEQEGLIDCAERTAGNQRRYDRSTRDRLRFIKHARDLGFPLDAIRSLIALQDHPDRSCAEATEIATTQLRDVERRIVQLTRLAAELTRITQNCDGDGMVSDCSVLEALGDHTLCSTDHIAPKTTP